MRAFVIFSVEMKNCMKAQAIKDINTSVVIFENYFK